MTHGRFRTFPRPAIVVRASPSLEPGGLRHNVVRAAHSEPALIGAAGQRLCHRRARRGELKDQGDERGRDRLSNPACHRDGADVMLCWKLKTLLGSYCALMARSRSTPSLPVGDLPVRHVSIRHIDVSATHIGRQRSGELSQPHLSLRIEWVVRRRECGYGHRIHRSRPSGVRRTRHHPNRADHRRQRCLLQGRRTRPSHARSAPPKNQPLHPTS
jgi:hypothetical protein